MRLAVEPQIPPHPDQMLRGVPMAKPQRRWVSGFSTIEMVIVLALFGFVLLSLVGLHLIAISAGSAAETSSIAANLSRARMEELLALPAERLKDQNDSEVRRQVPAGRGRTYTVRTTVAALDPARLDVTVLVTWQLNYGAACASAGRNTDCPGSGVTYARTLQTRVAILDQASVQP